jgi:uncharacterized protein YgbK (DUF1537 family)
MIIVIADDFAGAAEIAGIASRYGLVTELRTIPLTESNTDVLVIDSDTRSFPKAEARKKMNYILLKLKEIQPAWIFKKTDSVLRGHVLDEIVSTIKTFNQKMCVLLPANPKRNRIILNGHYFINGEFLHNTTFASDPEYPAKTADVIQLLGESPEISTFVKNVDQQLPNEGIIIGEAKNISDVKKWADKWQEDMLAAGGSEFFESLLDRLGYKAEYQTNSIVIPKDRNALCIWGSSINKDTHIYHQFNKAGFYILEIPAPDNLSDAELFINDLTQLSSKWLSKTGRIVLTFTSNVQRLGYLTVVIAKIVKNLLYVHPIGELIIEGGSTASAIARNMNWDQFIPIDEWMPGVVRLQVVNHPELVLTVKPGSYSWPAKFL